MKPSTKINWSKKVQTIYDDWRQTTRTLRKIGKCECCGQIVFEFDDGENDPRGVLGNRAASNLYASDYDELTRDVIACFNCANEYNSYMYLMELGRKKSTSLVRQAQPKEDCLRSTQTQSTNNQKYLLEDIWEVSNDGTEYLLAKVILFEG